MLVNSGKWVVRAALAAAATLLALLAPAGIAAAQAGGGAQAAGEPADRLLAEASWHGRSIQRPWPARDVSQVAESTGAASLRPGIGFRRDGGSERVRRLQRRLIALGYRPGSADGLFGPRTRAAVIAFQYKHGLPRTGVAGPQTLQTLRRRAEGPPPERTNTAGADDRRAAPRAAPAPQPMAVASPDGEAVPAASPSDATPWVLGLGVSLLVVTAMLASMLVPRRRERRTLAPAPSVSRRPRPAIGYAVGGETVLGRRVARIARGCDLRRLELLEVVTDPPPRHGDSAPERSGLGRVLRRVQQGDAATVVVTKFDDLGASDEEIRDVLESEAMGHVDVIALDDVDGRTGTAGSAPAHTERGGRSWKQEAEG